MMPDSTKRLLKWILPVLVLLAGAGATAALILSRQAPEPRQAPVLGPLVDVMTVTASDRTVRVSGQGEVRAAERVEVLPEVSGRVVSMHPRLVSGGRVGRGETLVQLDPRDYELAVESARASIAGAETRLEQERAEAEAALEEWRQVNGDAPAPKLLVREPQIRQIEAEQAAARAQLRKAELDLERTRLTAPFDAVVLSENVDLGQLVTSGRAVATLYGTRRAEVRVPLDDAELRWFDLPEKGRGPAAEVSADFAGRRHTWPAELVRLEGEVDPLTRMVHVVVEVEDPMARDGERPPLLPGAFVDVEIEGRELADVKRIPRYALRQGGVVWVVEDGKLHMREAEVLRKDRETIYVGDGLNPGDLVITSSLDGVTDGMAVRAVGLGDGQGDV